MVVGYISSYTTAKDLEDKLLKLGYTVRVYHGKNFE